MSTCIEAFGYPDDCVEEKKMAIDWSKPIQTKSGKKVRFLGELKADYAESFVAAVTDGDGQESVMQYNSAGIPTRLGADYLINVPEKIKLHIWLAGNNVQGHIVDSSCTTAVRASSAGWIVEVEKK